MPALHPHILRLAADLDCNVFVESGTYLGATLQAALDSGHFQRVYSVELVRELYERARKLVKSNPAAQVFWGKSHEIFRQQIFPLCDAKDHLFFFLDAHYSCGKTGGAHEPCPLMEELEAIRDAFPANGSVIVVDDTDDLGRDDPCLPGLHWPTRQEVEQIAYQINPQFVILDYSGSDPSMRKVGRGVLVFAYREPSAGWRAAPFDDISFVAPMLPAERVRKRLSRSPLGKAVRYARGILGRALAARRDAGQE